MEVSGTESSDEDFRRSSSNLVVAEVDQPRKSSFRGQLWTMIRRNLLLKRKSMKMTFIEFFIPSIFLLEFVLMGALMKSFNIAYPAVPEFVDQPLSYPGAPFNESRTEEINVFLVGFAPGNAQTKYVMNYTQTWWMTMNSSVLFYAVSFPSADDLEKMYLNESFKGVGVVFNDPDLNILNYTLRYPSNFVPPTSTPYIRPDSCRPLNTTVAAVRAPSICMANSYAYSGFVALQNLISSAYTQMKANGSEVTPLQLSTKMMPEGPTTVLNGGAAITSLPATYLANLLGFFVIFLVIYVVTEKEKKHIESMKIMGLRAAVYWLSWIILYGVIMIFMSLLALILAKGLSIWPKSDFFLLLIDCTIFGLSVIALGFCMASFFRRPLIAGLVTYALMQVFGFLFLVETFVPGMTESAKWGIAVMSPTAFFMTLSRVAQAEAQGWGIGFGNANNDPEFSFADALTMLTVDMVAYSILAFYLQKVFPSDDTPRQKPWFFLLPSYWCGHRGPLPSYTASMTSLFESGDIETVPEELRIKTAVSMNGLRKVFGNNVAVHDFTYEVYEDEILAILGHNGAGKTTIINMITGMISPTAGNALIYGKDVTKSRELTEARTMIGICPQHNILFDTLSVREHVIFYARLKGFTNKSAEVECERIMDETGMRGQADVQAQRLSGGQKRRLSIAIAAVGSPRVLILDEPTSGVDPFSQRFIWDMIRGFRKGRCVIISTQSMQEADVFADRKLIISHGRLRCAGTSLFLKNRFGLGYHLTLAVDKGCLENPITELVQSSVVGAEKTRSHAGELAYVLPKKEMAQFPGLFHMLDKHLEDLRIQSYGVSLTTMEEIFLKLAVDRAEEDVDLGEYNQKIMPEKVRSYSRLASRTFVSPTKGAVPGWRKFLALAKIRLLLMYRTKLSLIFQFVIPFMLLIMNGVLTIMARDWVIQLQGSDPLSMDVMGRDFVEKNVKYFYENGSGSSVDDVMQDLSRTGMTFDSVSYGDLSKSPSPHYGGYLFRNLSANGVVHSASIAYNGSAVHGIPFAAHLLLNTVFNMVAGSNETLHMIIHAFPNLKATTMQMFDFMFGSTLVSLALIMIPGVYGIDVCRDRQLKLRSQIRMTGCSFWTYWGSAFVTHIVQFLLSFGMVIALLYAFSVTAMTDAIELILTLFALHAPAMVLFCYCLSFLFKKFETAAIGLPFPMATISFILYLIVFMLNAFGEDVAAQVLHYIFAIVFPCYGFFGTMIFVQKISMDNSLVAQKGDVRKDYFHWNSNIPIVLVSHAVQIPLLILLLIYLESQFYNQHWLQFLGFTVRSSSNFAEVHHLGTEDDDVQLERNRVRDLEPSSGTMYSVLLRSLWKKFDSGARLARLKSCLSKKKRKVPEAKVAVKNLSVVFEKGEIFGLLGPNGAGKTTSLSMITGELTPTCGDVHVNGYNMHTETRQALDTMGSCPQTDTLWEDITMKEHLELFGILNDLPRERREDSIKTFAEGLYIIEHMDKKAAALSGGTKRKLTFVISMIGNPPLVMLDEPSTGMDPRSKRNLWDMIMESLSGQRSAILTTHSMEEADALCDRIGIIVKGELRCVGSSQHLKNKFGSGYLLEVKLSIPTGLSQNAQDMIMQRARNEVKIFLPGAFAVEEVYNRIVFSVPKESVTSLGDIFSGLDRLKHQLNFEEFSFSQTTLEQVFLHFARMQDAPDMPHNPSIPTNISLSSSYLSSSA